MAAGPFSVDSNTRVWTGAPHLVHAAFIFASENGIQISSSP